MCDRLCLGKQNAWRLAAPYSFAVNDFELGNVGHDIGIEWHGGIGSVVDLDLIGLGLRVVSLLDIDLKWLRIDGAGRWVVESANSDKLHARAAKTCANTHAVELGAGAGVGKQDG